MKRISKTYNDDDQHSHEQAQQLTERRNGLENVLDARRTYSSEAAFRAALNSRIGAVADRTGRPANCPPQPGRPQGLRSRLGGQR
ncbi:MAG: hypothetical protein K0U76_01520 [Actinomycetia bacterium]|nr:hypothetical protein [Actinomycetes bacterium]MCH9700061.1 hypothetical protein [Actinomycetes bacterium]MCH9762563.1 hypothetical protein [Actinomycetes bacterium]